VGLFFYQDNVCHSKKVSLKRLFLATLELRLNQVDHRSRLSQSHYLKLANLKRKGNNMAITEYNKSQMEKYISKKAKKKHEKGESKKMEMMEKKKKMHKGK